MKFFKKEFKNGQYTYADVEFESFEAAVKEMEAQFYEDPDIKCIEQRKFENGSQSISLKNVSGKIVVQLQVIIEVDRHKLN